MKACLSIMILLNIILFPFPFLSRAEEFEKENLVLSLRECINLALKRNRDIIIERINPRIQEMEIIKEKAIFDPLFTLEITNNESVTRPTSVISGAGSDSWIGRLFGWEEDLEQESFDFSARLATKMITGGTCELSFNNNRFITNSIYQYYDKTYRSNLKFSLIQPLLRDSGIEFNWSQIRIAGNNRDISRDELKVKATAIVSRVQEVYWDLVAAIEELTVRNKSLRSAEDLLAQNKALVKAGRLASLAILQAETGLASRKEGVLLAKNAVKNADDRLRKMIDLLEDLPQKKGAIIPKDRPTFIPKEINAADSFAKALKDRPEFDQAKIALSNQRLTFNMAKNQLLPKLDLGASYTLNGTDSRYRENLDDFSEGDNYSWEAGVVLEVPLGNRWARSQYIQEKMRMKKYDVKVDEVKKNILLEVKESVREIETNRERIKVTRSARKLAEKKLQAEEERFKLGRSTTTDLLKFQEELSQARSSENRALIDYQKSLIHWEAATGQTLHKNDIRIASD